MKILGLDHRANNILGYQEKDGTYVAILKCPINKIKNVKIYYDDPYNWKKINDSWENSKWSCEKQTKWIQKEKDDIFEYFTFKLDSLEKRYKYFFVFDYEGKKYSYGEFGLIEFIEKDEFNYHSFAFTWNFSSIGKYIGAPDWWNESNWYQIFPDRFLSSKKEKMESDYNDEHTLTGGDIKGIILKLDYIQNLGFNGIYLNPIFLAMSAHKYDTLDYKKIDPDFGTMQDFENLILELKKRNMKIMLDGVFNHVGAKHFIWKDVIKNKEKSKYKDWFFIRDFNNLKNHEEYKNFSSNKAYGTFANTEKMPRLNWNNKEVSDFIIDIIKFWTKKGINAWRMDVADEVSFDMWRKVRACLKELNPNIVLLGEVWYDASIFLRGDQFHSSMNYPFRENILKSFNEKYINLKSFVDTHVTNGYKYSNEINKGLFNLVSSHDTPRLSSMFGKDLIKTRIGIALLLLSQGVISFYYGDEIDLDWDKYRFNRGAFNWEFNKKNITYKMVKKLMNFRNKNIHSIVKGIKFKQTNNKILNLSFDANNNIDINLEKSTIIINEKNNKETIHLKEMENE